MPVTDGFASWSMALGLALSPQVMSLHLKHVHFKSI